MKDSYQCLVLVPKVRTLTLTRVRWLSFEVLDFPEAGFWTEVALKGSRITSALPTTRPASHWKSATGYTNRI